MYPSPSRSRGECTQPRRVSHESMVQVLRSSQSIWSSTRTGWQPVPARAPGVVGSQRSVPLHALPSPHIESSGTRVQTRVSSSQLTSRVQLYRSSQGLVPAAQRPITQRSAPLQ